MSIAHAHSVNPNSRERDSLGRFIRTPRPRGRPRSTPAQIARRKRRHAERMRGYRRDEKIRRDRERIEKEIREIEARARGFSRTHEKAHIRNNLRNKPLGEKPQDKSMNEELKKCCAVFQGRRAERLSIPRNERMGLTGEEVGQIGVAYIRFGLEATLKIIRAYSRIDHEELIGRGLPTSQLTSERFCRALLAAFEGKPSEVSIDRRDLWAMKRDRKRQAYAAFGAVTASRESAQKAAEQRVKEAARASALGRSETASQGASFGVKQPPQFRRQTPEEDARKRAEMLAQLERYM